MGMWPHWSSVFVFVGLERGAGGLEFWAVVYLDVTHVMIDVCVYNIMQDQACTKKRYVYRYEYTTCDIYIHVYIHYMLYISLYISIYKYTE